MKCNICGKRCDGKLVIRDKHIIELSPFIVCSECFKLFTSQDYDGLVERVKK